MNAGKYYASRFLTSLDVFTANMTWPKAAFAISISISIPVCLTIGWVNTVRILADRNYSYKGEHHQLIAPDTSIYD